MTSVVFGAQRLNGNAVFQSIERVAGSAYSLVASASAYSLLCGSATFARSSHYQLTANSCGYSVSGMSASMSYSGGSHSVARVMSATPATFCISGASASFHREFTFEYANAPIGSGYPRTLLNEFRPKQENTKRY